MVEKTPIDLTMDRLSVNNILKIQQLTNELEFERATSIFLRIRKEAKEDPFLSEVRNHLKKLIKNYEGKYWYDEKQISEGQVKENDLAEKLVRDENAFIHKRKKLIRKKLKEFSLNQNDLARILGHHKGYMSELINGLRPFSKEDIIIVHRLLKIEFEDLIPPFIPQKRATQIKNVLKKLPASNAKLKKQDLENAL